MESEEILGPQFSVHWSTCSSIPGSDFLSATGQPVPQSLEAISYQRSSIPGSDFLSAFGKEVKNLNQTKVKEVIRKLELRSGTFAGVNKAE